MKPIKGMNLDVSPDSQTPNTYRHARNWVYDAEFDGLIQEPGYTSMASLAEKHAVAQYAFENGDIVFLCLTAASTTSGDTIQLYSEEANTYTEVYTNASLAFNRTRVYDFASFTNALNQRILIISDGVEKPLAINIDIASSDQPSHDLQTLFPTRKQADIQIDSLSSGTLAKGSYFFAVRYLMEDETALSFGPLHGPYVVTKSGGGISLTLDNIDTNYSGLEIGVIQYVDNSARAFVGAAVQSLTADMVIFIEGTERAELVLEDIIVTPNTYGKAGSVEIHENRLYLGNVSTPEDAATLQGIANNIQPIWVMERNGGGEDGVEAGTESNPTNARFQPDEVYAFYVAWIRDDGSYTRAYHIPGRTPRTTITVPVHAAAASGVSASSAQFDPRTTITSLLADSSGANLNGCLNYLKNDRNIFDSTETGYNQIKYFHTRGTARAFTNQTAYHWGECGYWENANEVYPSNFPAGETKVWNSSGLSLANTVDLALAGEPVRHHRLPSLAWMFENVTDFNFDANKNQAFKMRFEYLQIPAGMKGAVVYHAKRTNSNNLVISHTPMHFGAANHYSLWGEGGDGFKDHSTVSPINGPMHNNLLHLSGGIGPNIASSRLTALRDQAGDPKKKDGSSFASTDLYEGGSSSTSSWSDWVNSEFQDRLKVHYNKGVALPHDLLATRPVLPAKLYTRFEYMLVQMEHFPVEIEDNRGTNSSVPYIMRIAGPGAAYYSTTDDVDGGKCRRAVFDLNSFTANVTRSFPQSEIKPLRNQRYVPAGVVDSEVKFDNRFGAECVYWEFKSDTNSAPYNVDGYHDSGERMWYSVLNNPDTLADDGTGDTDNSGYDNTIAGTNYSHLNRFGYWLQSQWTTAGTLAVQRLPFVNLTALRFDCYFGYDTQDLVACTPVLTADNMSQAPNIGGTGSAAKTASQDIIHGDIHFSRRRYRVTSSTGFNAGLGSSDEAGLIAANPTSIQGNTINTRALEGLTTGGTVNSLIGTVNVLCEVPVYSPLHSVIHDTDKLQTKATERNRLIENTNPINTNDFTFNIDLTRLNDFIQPIVNLTDKDYPVNFTNRVARSNKQDLNTASLAFRTFPALDYVEQPRNRGAISNLQGFGDKLLIHHEQGLFITVGKEGVSTSAGQLVIGTGDIFRVTPTEIAPSEHGFAGTQHKQSCMMTPLGYFFVDAAQAKVFLYNGKLEEISNRGLRSYFQDAFDFNKSFFAGSNSQGFCPGILAEYDPKNNRILMMVRNSVNNANSNSGVYPLNIKSYHGSNDYTDSTDILSYSFNNNAWVAFHDLRMQGFIGTPTNFYGWHTDVNHLLYRLTDLSNASITYSHQSHTETLAPYIDIAFPANEPVQWQSFSWHTKAVEHVPGDSNAGHIDLNKTFVKAAVYNDYQCSGDQSFIKASDIDVSTYQRVTLRHNGTHYQFNGFRDLVNDRAARFIDENQEFVTTNINSSLEWHNQRRFKSTYAIVRLIVPTTTTNLLYLYDVDAKVRKSYR
jgi:hypothetical protein